MDIQSPVEAVRALGSQLPGFVGAIYEGEFKVLRGDEALDEELMTMTMGRCTELHFTPVPVGSKSDGVKIVIGIAIIALAWYAAPAAAGGGVAWGASTGFLGVTYGNIAMIGAAIALSGAAGMLSPVPTAGDYNDLDDNPASALYNGPTNTNTQGVPVPLIYGQAMAGSVVIAAGITADQKPTSGVTYTHALEFDGVDDEVDLGTAIALDINPPFTIHGWFMANSWSGGGNTIISRGGVGSGGWALRVENNGADINLKRFDVADQIYSPTTPLQIETWYSIIAVQTRDGAEYYLDDDDTPNLAGSGKIINAYSGNAYIGRDAVGNYWDGVIEDVKFWGRDVPDELEDILALEQPEDDDRLFGYWKFNEGEGLTTVDSSLNTNDGTITGARWVIPAVRPQPKNFLNIIHLPFGWSRP